MFNQTLSDFVIGAGGTTETIPFVDVIPALQRGVADCAVTGTLSGNAAKWPAVTTHIYPMAAGWSIAFRAVNLDTWNGYAPALRDFLTQAFATFEVKAWEIAQITMDEGLHCDLGKDPCTLGIKAAKTLVPMGDKDMAVHREIMQQSVRRRWAERCGAARAREWNETVGMTAPVGFWADAGGGRLPRTGFG